MRTLEDVLEEITPTPDPDFVADMERRMRRGFPRRAQAAPAAVRLPAPPARDRGRRGQRAARAARRGLAHGRSDDEAADGAPVAEPQRPASAERRHAAAPGCERRAAPAPQPIPPRGGGGDRARRRDPPHRALARSSRSRPTPTSSTGSRTRSSASPTAATASCCSSSFTQGEEGFEQRLLRAARSRPTELQPTLNELSRARDRPRAQRVGHRRHRRVRLAPRPAAHRAGASARACCAGSSWPTTDTRRARDPAAARDRRQQDHRPARPVPRRRASAPSTRRSRRARGRGRRRAVRGRDRRGARRRGRVARGRPELPDPGGRRPDPARARRSSSCWLVAAYARRRARERALA